MSKDIETIISYLKSPDESLWTLGINLLEYLHIPRRLRRKYYKIRNSAINYINFNECIKLVKYYKNSIDLRLLEILCQILPLIDYDYQNLYGWELQFN